jgi:hypothetical protein
MAGLGDECIINSISWAARQFLPLVAWDCEIETKRQPRHPPTHTSVSIATKIIEPQSCAEGHARSNPKILRRDITTAHTRAHDLSSSLLVYDNNRIRIHTVVTKGGVCGVTAAENKQVTPQVLTRWDKTHCQRCSEGEISTEHGARTTTWPAVTLLE